MNTPTVFRVSDYTGVYFEQIETSWSTVLSNSNVGADMSDPSQWMISDDCNWFKIGSTYLGRSAQHSFIWKISDVKPYPTFTTKNT